MIEKSRLIQLIIFGLLTAASYGVYEAYYADESSTQYEPFTKGYSLEGVVIKTSDESGAIISTMKSPLMVHYADTEVSVITSPQYIMHQDDGDWVFKSAKGEINKGQTEVFFPEAVDLTLDAEGPDPVSIQTSQLRIEINKKMGVTDENISVIRPGLLLTGMGSVINFADHSIEILEDMYAEFEN